MRKCYALAANFLFVLLMVSGVSWGQVTIAKQDFEATPASPVLTFLTADIGSPGNSTGTSSGTSGSTSAPSGSNLFAAGTQGYRIQGGSTSSTAGRTLTFASVNTSAYSNISFSIRVAGMSIGSTGNGMDRTVDQVLIDISPDGGNTWYQQLLLNITGTGSNARWNFSGTGSGSKTYSANNSFTTSSVNVGSSSGLNVTGTAAITTLTVTGLPQVENLQVRVSAQCNDANESWILDDAILTGTPLTPTTTSINPSTAIEGSSAFTLTVNGSNFIDGRSTITWNGSNRTTTFINSTQLSAAITAADIAVAGNVNVGVTTTGAASASNTQLFTINANVAPSLSITDNGTQPAAGNINQGSTNNILQTFIITEGNTAAATLNTVKVPLSGSYTSTDIVTSGLKLYASTTNDFSSATLLSSQSATATGTGETVTFGSLSYNIAKNTEAYFWVTADVSVSASDIRNINAAANSTASNFTFASGTPTVSISAGGTKTFATVTPTIALANGASPVSSVAASTTNVVLYRVDVTIGNTAAILNAIKFVTTGHLASDVTNFKLWYHTNSSFTNGSPILLATNSAAAAGTQDFSGLSRSFPVGTNYIFLTTDVSCYAAGNQIGVNAINNSDVTFATGTPTGSGYTAGGIVSFTASTLNTPTGITSTAGNGQVSVAWTNPTGCYDEVMIVAATASNNGTPSGNGSSYTASLTYSGGTALGNGFVVYKGNTSPQIITGLTNGTQYYFMFFTRFGSSWNTGTEINATPQVAGYYWNGGTISANPAAGGTGTWGTTNAWRQPSNSGSQATWADNNNAIFAGTAGTVTLDGNRSATAYYFNTSGYTLASPATTYTLTGVINLANNVQLTLAPNVNTGTPASGTINLASGVSGNATTTLNISSVQGTNSTVAQRINLAGNNISISSPITITSAGGTGTASVAGFVATATGTSLTSTATITNNSAIKTILGATSGNDLTVNGIISGSADLQFSAGASGGAGTVTLNAVNTYTGATIFNAAGSGIIKLGVDNALPVSTAVTMANSSNNGGILDLNGFNQTFASISNGSGSGSIRNLGTADATLTIDGSATTTFGLAITDGTGATNKTLLKVNGGSLTLSGTNTYTGLTTVSGGTLVLNRTGGTTIPVTNNVTVNGGTLRISSNQTVNNLIISSGTLIVDAGITLTINGTYTGGGTITNNGTIILGTGITDFPGSTTNVSAMNNLQVSTNSVISLNNSLTISGTLTLNTSGVLSIGSNTLTINGAVSGTGTLKGSSSSNLIIGGTAGTLNFTSGGRILKDLTLNSGASATIGTALDITAGSSAGVVTVASGATLNTGGNLTLKSDTLGTARVANSAGAISGNVTVERFIPNYGKRAWRLLAVPVTGNQTIADSWQQNVWITSNSSSALANGFDAQTPGNSMLTYDSANNVFNGVNSTAIALSANDGYFLFVRGNRTSTNSNTSITNTTLSATGLLRTGTQSNIKVPSNKFVLIGNPYASAIDFLNISRSNTSNTFWLWDPKLGTTGGYQNFSAANNYDPSPGGGSFGTSANTIIQSGSAFFVQGLISSDGSLQIAESAKSSTTSTNKGFKTGNLYTRTKLRLYDANNNNLLDGAVTVLDNSFSIAIDQDDALKPSNFNENVAFVRSNTKLSVEARPEVNSVDTLFINLWNTTQKNYSFVIEPDNFSAGNLQAVLQDSYLNTATALSLINPTTVNFSIDANAASKAVDRFRIVFTPSSTLSTTGLTVKASLVEKQVRIDWSMVNENNLKGYTVERSSDGKTFTALTAVNAKANDNSTVSYDAMDASPLNGMNYYRIKATDVNGKITYSAIVRIKTNDTKASVTVYPNPVKGEQLNIQLNGLSKGTYTIRLYNNLGQEVYGSTLQVTQAAMSQTLNIAALKTSGVYTLRITNGDQTIEQTIVAQ